MQVSLEIVYAGTAILFCIVVWLSHIVGEEIKTTAVRLDDPPNPTLTIVNYLLTFVGIGGMLLFSCLFAHVLTARLP